MASKAVVDAVEARIGPTWNDIPVVGANTRGSPPDETTEYLLVQYPVSNTRRPVIDRRFYQEEGAFRVVLNTARGFGIARAITICDQLAALFRDQKFSDVVCQVPSSPFIDDSNDQGNFFKAAVVFPYTHTFEG